MGKNVLVIEDEVYVQRLIQLLLEKEGWSVRVASTGEEGLAALADGSPLPHLVLLDILMPGLDGLQVLKTLKANQATKQVPVVLLTALAQENVVLQGIKLGAKDYVRKPFHPAELISRLRKHLT